MKYTPDTRISTAVNRFEPGLKPSCRSAHVNVIPTKKPTNKTDAIYIEI